MDSTRGVETNVSAQRIWRSCALVLLAGLLVISLSPFAARSSRAAGRTIAVTGLLQDAIDAALPGDVLVLQSSVYTERVLINTAGTAAAPIMIAGAGIGRSILHGTLLLRENAAFWRIQDLDVDAGGGSKDAVRLETGSHDVRLQRMHIYNGQGYGVRISNDVSNVLIEDSEIDHFDAGTADAHGVGIMTASAVTIRRCDIHHNSGDSIQSNTPDYPGYNRFASAILIEQNKLHENRENALDIKSTHGLIAQQPDVGLRSREHLRWYGDSGAVRCAGYSDRE
jgi:parallel beta helix pectate lyase-like protein